MKRNRVVSKKMSVMTEHALRFGAIIVFSFVMVILNCLSSSTCTQLIKEKGEKERLLAKLEESRLRESSRWEEMKAPEKIERALLYHGLSMKLPRPDQNVRMRSDGTPSLGQISVARVRQRGPETIQTRYRRKSNRVDRTRVR